MLFIHTLRIYEITVIMKEYLKNLKKKKTYSTYLAAYPKWQAGTLSQRTKQK